MERCSNYWANLKDIGGTIVIKLRDFFKMV